jgi:hypothetical protein
MRSTCLRERSHGDAPTDTRTVSVGNLSRPSASAGRSFPNVFSFGTAPASTRFRTSTSIVVLPIGSDRCIALAMPYPSTRMRSAAKHCIRGVSGPHVQALRRGRKEAGPNQSQSGVHLFPKMRMRPGMLYTQSLYMRIMCINNSFGTMDCFEGRCESDRQHECHPRTSDSSGG